MVVEAISQMNEGSVAPLRLENNKTPCRRVTCASDPAMTGIYACKSR
jgi:hypothetical protein